MVIPDWLYNLLVKLHLAKSAADPTANLEEQLRELNTQRNREYDKMEGMEAKIKLLEQGTSAHMRSDLSTLKADLQRVSNKLALLNTNIFQIKTLLGLKEQDELTETINSRVLALQQAIAKVEISKERIAVAIDDIQEGNAIQFEDPTLAGNANQSTESAGAVKQEAQQQTSAPQNENANTNL